jgi:monoamine oxidase
VLEENNIRYAILEATDRYGGRLKEDTAFADFPIDLGAEWIHNLPVILDVVSWVEGAS